MFNKEVFIKRLKFYLAIARGFRKSMKKRKLRTTVFSSKKKGRFS